MEISNHHDHVSQRESQDDSNDSLISSGPSSVQSDVNSKSFKDDLEANNDQDDLIREKSEEKSEFQAILQKKWIR